ncbi:MAG: N-6 DNA methylase, partial [Christensenellaceae bacterium]|nr:N-6 DNA methylase [Christensenellaceae bacterium]
DVELSIDPEMLGRIFENLLAEINPETGESARKRTGSFYTPREIVDYMVDATLLEYLKDKTAIPEEKLDNLITYNRDDYLPILTYDERESIINSLFSLTILDPACGSGAFPIGILQKIVYVLQEIDPNAEIWVDRVCRDATAFFKQEIKKKFGINALDYIRKLSVLQNSIFGVDIQSIAVEIARIRCFLSLVIEDKVLDNEPNRGILPLPNLDFKFIVANTLVKLDAGEQLSFFENQSSMNALNRVRYDYFNANDTTRCKLKNDFYAIQSTMLKETAKNYQGLASRRHEQLSKWNPFENTITNWFDAFLSLGVPAFDIVIANPPYVQLQYMNKKDVLEIIGSKKRLEYMTYEGRGDLYVLFYERGLNLLKQNGLLGYITSNKWMRSSYGELLRTYFVKNTNPIRLIDLGGGRFKSATVDTNIIILQKSINRHKMKAIKYRDSSLTNISNYVKRNEIAIDFTAGSAWTIVTTVEQKILQKIDTFGIPLSEWNININRGVLTGCNEAFVINKATRDRLVEQDPRSDEIIRPLLRGRDIIKGKCCFANIYLIASHDGYYDDEQKYIPPIDVASYPSVKKHLDQFCEKIHLRQDKGNTPYNLRYCKIMNDFSKPVICWQRIATMPGFCTTENGMVLLDSCGLLSNLGDNKEYLLSVLNSKLFSFWVDKNAHQLGENSYRISVQHMESFKIPLKSYPDRKLTDFEVFALYNLTDEESNYLLDYRS